MEGIQNRTPTTDHFVITKELALSSDITLACWCPTMDLCAVVSDGQLYLHRMDWQLLWAVSPEAQITTVCWRPDGKELAAGDSQGGISILNVESGDLVAKHKVHYAALACLSWADQADCGATSSIQQQTSQLNSSHSIKQQQQQLFSAAHSIAPHQRFKRLFVPPILEPHPPSSSEPLPDPYDLSMDATGAAAWPEERQGFSLLAAADVRGRISLWQQGQVQVAEMSGTSCSTSSSVDAGPVKVLNVVLNSHLSQIYTINSSPAGTLSVLAHSLGVLQRQQEPLVQCTSLFMQLQTLFKAVVKCVEVCWQDWSSAMADFRKKFHTQLKQELADQGSSVTEPQLELMLLLATGTCTAPLQSFLGSTLSEAGLRRLARGLDSTAGGVHTALLERVMPLAELVLFLLGELRGCVACAAAAAGHQATAAEGSCWMGLKVELLQQLQLHAAALLLRCEQLRRCVTNAACQYRAFFTWLLKVVRQLEGQREDGDDNNDAGTPLPVGLAVTSFLKEQFMHDLIGAELSGKPLTPDAQQRADAAFYQGINSPTAHKLLALLLPGCCNSNDSSSSSWQHAAASLITAATAPAGLHATTIERIDGIAAGSTQQQQQQHEGSIRLAALGCSRPLAQQLQHLVSLCDDAFEQPVMAVSPCVQPVAELQLLPHASHGAAVDNGGTDASSSGSSGSSGSTQVHVAVAAPLLQPQQWQDSHVYVCCRVPAVIVATAHPGTHTGSTHSMLLVVRIPANSPKGLLGQQQQGQQQQQQAGLSADAILLQLPPSEQPEAWAFYRGQQLALLLQQGAVESRAGGHSSSLHLLSLAEAPWTFIQMQQQQATPASSSSSVAEQCLKQQAVVSFADVHHRSRRLQQGVNGQLLSVSRSRGLAGVVSDMQHLLLLDLEDDEGNEEEEAQQEEAGDEEPEGSEMAD